MTDWYTVKNIDLIASPALLVYPQRAKQNIAQLIGRVPGVEFLRPHVKTNKMPAVCQFMLQQGITKFKCATIAEAEMLGTISAPDVLLAYQPVGPNIGRFIKLCMQYSATRFSCIIDNIATLQALAEAAAAANIIANVFIDLNVGMDRTGIKPEKASDLLASCIDLNNIQLMGLHSYDGHVSNTDVTVRQLNSNAGFERVAAFKVAAEKQYGLNLTIVAGGSPSFITHAHRNVECSPGTFVFWDWGYKHKLPHEPYEYAALVLSRVISVIDEQTICTDLGHKSVAAENPLPRVYFLNAQGAVPVSQSEEHLVLKVQKSTDFSIGQVLYGVPVHICPTVALYDEAVVIEDGMATGTWPIVARKRRLTI